MSMKYKGSTMKIVLTTAILALAPAFMAQARDLPRPTSPTIPSCVDLSSQADGNGSASRQSTVTDEVPCPRFLSTTTIQRKRAPQWT
jgi:hypothetical protein